MLYAPVALVVVSVDIPVATFLAEIFAFGMAPPCASVMVPDNVAPVTCAPRGTVITIPRQKIQAKNRHLTVLKLIDAHPFCFYFSIRAETPLPRENRAPHCRSSTRLKSDTFRAVRSPIHGQLKGSSGTHLTRPCQPAEYSRTKEKLAGPMQLRVRRTLRGRDYGCPKSYR